MTPIPPPYYNNDPESFAYPSAHTRWPTILTQAIDDLSRAIGDLVAKGSQETAVAEGKTLIQQLSAILYDLDHDRTIAPFDAAVAAEVKDLASYNAGIAALEAGRTTWHTAPWLISECVLYRRIALVFETAQSPEWKAYDVFGASKRAGLLSSRAGVTELATRYAQVSQQWPKETEKLRALFAEFVDIALWGNATDLSLLIGAEASDLAKLQGQAARAQQEANVLVNDTQDAWDAVYGAHEAGGARVDFVLDNAGFELYSDLVFALFLLDSGLVDSVVLHPKSVPWFVSDVVPADVVALVHQIKGFAEEEKDAGKASALNLIAEKLAFYLGEEAAEAAGVNRQGRIHVRTNVFWTSYLSYRDELHPGGKGGGAQAWEDLKDSALVVFKGDLNHRKLLGDLAWPRTTPFLSAIGGKLAASGVRLVTLRTIKADVVVGLKEGQEAELVATWKQIKGGDDGRGWAYSGKWAVIEYSDGSL